MKNIPLTTNPTLSGLIKAAYRSRALLAGTSTFLLLTGGALNAQTNPTAQNIPYTQNFGTTTFTTPPTGFAVWNGVTGETTNTQALAEGSTPTGSATLAVATAATTTGGAYGYAAASNAKLYIQTSGNATNGVNQPVLAIDTIGKTNVTLSYEVESISAQAREIGIVSQFRVGTTGTWTTITPALGSNPYVQTADTTGLKTTVSAVLPASAEGQPVVQIRWAFWRAGTTGSSSGLAIDNVSVTTGGIVPDTTPPTLVSQVPTVAATNVGLSPSISITFSETVVAGAGTVQLFQEAGSSDVLVPIGTVGISGSTASFSPTSPLLPSTTYYVLIANNAFLDSALPTPNAFAGISSETAWTFTTDTGVIPAALVVINEVYGGGGNSGAPYTNDFVELYNTTNAPISLANYSIQYAGATGTTWALNNLSGSIPANGYYLLQLSGGSTGIALPNPNATGTSNLSATAGKIALTNTQTALTGLDPFPNSTIVDFVGYGTNASASETAPAPAPSSTQSISRTAFADTGDNSVNFTVGIPSPTSSATSDTVPPSVLSLNPIDGSTTATPTQNLGITFSETVIKGTGNILIKLVSDDSTVETIDVASALVSVSGAVATINPAGDLVAGTAYYVNIPNTAFRDAALNFYLGITTTTAWNFTVETPAPTGTLTAGDIAFVGYATGSDDHFSFVALKQIPAGEIIRFSDNEWNGTAIGSGGSFNPGEGFITWTAPASPVAQGTVIRLDDIASLTVLPSASIGTIALATGVGGSFNMGSAGDTVYAFQGGTSTPTHFLSALTTNGSTDSVANTGLIPSSHVVSLPLLVTPDQFDHYQYNGPRTTLTSFAAYLTETVNAANWITNDELEDPAVVFNMTSFAISGPPSNNYSSWATTNSAAGGVNGDHDNDGVRNGVEFFMGQTGSTFTPNPVLGATAPNRISYPRDATATGVTGVIETSPDLVVWTPQTSDTTSVPGSISYTLPTGQGKIFARLNVVVTTP
jgi:Bacterial Ig-like domain/Lamin Tail Domain